MKRLLLSFFALLTAGAAQAQQAIPEGGLENWATRNGALAPTGWQTTDDLLASTPFPIVTGTVTRTNSSFAGTYAAQLTTTNVAPFGEFPGLLYIGSSINANSDGLAGIAYTSRPARMEFRYKLSATQSGAIANDSAAAAVQLTRTVNGTQEIIALGVQYLLTSAPNYTQGIVTFQYVSNAQPDTLRMVFASGSANNITAGTTLVVDAVTMAGTATAKRDAAVQLALSVYPTQSPDGRFTLAAPDQPALLLGALRVSDATGRVVHTQAAAPAAGPRTVDLHGQAPGVYVLRLDTPAGPLTRKLVVQ